MTETSDMVIFWIVVLARLLIPLAIPRFPLPAILAALILDAVDQTIFQVTTNLNLEGYQGYDKALDIYYLTIAYISTMRNWRNLFAFRVNQFLFYYRLFGVTLFELTHLRWLLIVFPNTFEYFFIFYEIVRLRWDPRRLTRRQSIIAAAAIWIFIKLPQEYWIHIAQLDMTDFLKENIFNVPLDATISEILQANPWVIPVLIILTVAIVLFVRWLLRRLPDADWSLSFDVNKRLDDLDAIKEAGEVNREPEKFLNMILVEKIVMVSLVSVIFAQILPDVQATNLQLAVGVAFVIALNTVISHWLARRGTEWRHSLTQFVAMAAVNFGLALLYIFLLPSFDGSLNLTNTLFFTLLLTLLVVLFDRYRQVFDLRFSKPIEAS